MKHILVLYILVTMKSAEEDRRRPINIQNCIVYTWYTIYLYIHYKQSFRYTWMMPSGFDLYNDNTGSWPDHRSCTFPGLRVA